MTHYPSIINHVFIDSVTHFLSSCYMTLFPDPGLHPNDQCQQGGGNPAGLWSSRSDPGSLRLRTGQQWRYAIGARRGGRPRGGCGHEARSLQTDHQFIDLVAGRHLQRKLQLLEDPHHRLVLEQDLGGEGVESLPLGQVDDVLQELDPDPLVLEVVSYGIGSMAIVGYCDRAARGLTRRSGRPVRMASFGARPKASMGGEGGQSAAAGG